MALQMGNASKGKIVVVGALIVVALGGVSYELYNQLSTSGPPAVRPAATAARSSATTENAPAARTTARQGAQKPAATGEEAKKLANPESIQRFTSACSRRARTWNTREREEIYFRRSLCRYRFLSRS